MDSAKERIADMAAYVDHLLLKIMENKPEILQIDAGNVAKRKVHKA